MNRLHPDDIKAIIDGLAPRIIQGVISGLKQYEEMDMDLEFIMTLPQPERKRALKARVEAKRREAQQQSKTSGGL